MVEPKATPISQIDTKFKDEVKLRIGGRNLDYCLQCGTCNTSCPVRNVDAEFNPREIIRMVLSGREDYLEQYPELSYACLLCELCEKACPLGLKVGELMLAIREQLVGQRLGPLPGHKYVKDELAWSLSDSITLSLRDPDASECNRVFFPGCNLSAYSPQLVIDTYEYLRTKMPSTGIILRCCGAPSHGIGDHSRFQEVVGQLEHEMGKLGAYELIVSCPDCYRTLKRAAPRFQLTSLFAVLEEVGIPQINQKAKNTFSLHDSCTARWEKELQDSVRNVVKLSGHEIEEMLYSRELTKCCGMGGLTATLNLYRVFNLTQQRVAEADFDILTYCAACRETFAAHKPSLHVLDLLFNPNWDEARTKRPNKLATRRENRERLRSRLIDKE